MKHSLEEIKAMLEVIPQGEWSFEDNEMCIEGVPICTFFTAEDFPCVPIEDEPKLEEELKRLKSFIAAAPTIIRDLLAEVERLQDEINEARATCYDCEYYGPHKTARLEFQDQLQAAQALAATHLADQELLVGRERKRVARECAEIADSNADEYQDEMNIYPDGDPKVEVYEKAMVACEYIAKEIRIRYGVEG